MTYAPIWSFLSFSAIGTFEIRDAYFGSKGLQKTEVHAQVLFSHAIDGKHMSTCTQHYNWIKNPIKLLLNKYFRDVDI